MSRVDLALASVLGRLPSRRMRTSAKRHAELAYWRRQRSLEGGLLGYQYERFFTDYFGLAREGYRGKRILDIGCGPRGTLEWAEDASERIGLDPLAGDYRKLGAGEHAMTYVDGRAESIPFATGHFDVVASFNSLDHVDDLDLAIAEIARVTAAGGWLLLLTEVGHDPTFTEPQAFGWEVLDRFAGDWTVLEARRIARSAQTMMGSLDNGVELDADDPGPGYLAARLERAR